MTRFIVFEVEDVLFYRRRTITKWKIFSSAVCALGFLFGIFVMPQHIAAAETKTSAVTALSSPDVKGGAAVDSRIEQNQVVKVKNVWETLEWVGRRPEELKLAGAEASGNTGIDFSGDWYGHVVKGTAYVKKNYSSPQREAVVYEIFFTDDLPYYDAMIRDIEKRYGKPYIQAEEPYVERNRTWSLTGVVCSTITIGREKEVSISPLRKSMIFTFSGIISRRNRSR